MVNHPNRGWRSRWTVDQEAATAAHIDGWVFRFSPVDGEPGAFDGECVAQPNPITEEHLAAAPRVAREAGEVYQESLRAKH